MSDENKPHNPPAFPNKYSPNIGETTGMSLIDYLVAHAPIKPEWFVSSHEAPERPTTWSETAMSVMSKQDKEKWTNDWAEWRKLTPIYEMNSLIEWQFTYAESVLKERAKK